MQWPKKLQGTLVQLMKAALPMGLVYILALTFAVAHQYINVDRLSVCNGRDVTSATCTLGTSLLTVTVADMVIFFIAP